MANKGGKPLCPIGYVKATFFGVMAISDWVLKTVLLLRNAIALKGLLSNPFKEQSHDLDF